MQDASADITDPLSGNLVEFLKIGKIIKDLLFPIFQLLKDLLDCQRIVVWNMDMLSLLGLNLYTISSMLVGKESALTLLLARDDVL